MSKHRIFINGRFLTQNTTGVQRYACEVVKAIDALLSDEHSRWNGCEFILLAPPGASHFPGLRRVRTAVVGRLRGHLWEQMELSAYARSGFLLNLCNTGPVACRNALVTIHDASVFVVPEAYSWAFRSWYRLLLPALGRTARHILTGSEFSRVELQHHAGISGEKIKVIPLGADHMSSAPACMRVFQRLGLRRRQYALAASTQSPHKNFQGIARAIELLGGGDFELVVVGGVNTKVFKHNGVPDTDTYRAAGYVTDGELRALYEHASCFVYPSFYEGFGLPPLEAMACGCPVLVSRAASLPEVCGDAAIYCDPHDPANIAQHLSEIMGSRALQESLRQRGLDRVRAFTWSKTAGGVLDQLEMALPT